MVSKAFFQIDENHTIYKAIVDIDRPTISDFNQCSECHCAMIRIQIGSELVSCYH